MQERVAAGDAARAKAALWAAEQVAEELGVAAGGVEVRATAPASEFVADLLRGDRLALDASQARRQVRMLHGESTEAARVWTLAAQKTKVLEKLKEKHTQTVNHALAQAEIRSVDDLVTRAYAVRTQTEGHQ